MYKKAIVGLLISTLLATQLPIHLLANEMNINISEMNEDLLESNQQGTIQYPGVGGRIEFDLVTGTIVKADRGILSIEIPETIEGVPVTQIGPQAFQYCKQLSDISIPDTVTVIGAYAFNNCNSMLLEEIKLPKQLTKIEEGAFAGTSLTKIVIPENVTIIEKNAFNTSRFLETVSMSEHLIEIGEGAFNFCQSLEEITLPSSIKKVGDYAFENSNLKTIYYTGSEKEWEDIDIHYDKNKKVQDAEIYYNHYLNVAPPHLSVVPPHLSESNQSTLSTSETSKLSNRYPRNAIILLNSQGGTVKANTKYTTKGTAVSITIIPDKGYILDTLSITTKDGTSLTATKKDYSIYQFTMVDTDVEVQAEFKKIE